MLARNHFVFYPMCLLVLACVVPTMAQESAQETLPTGSWKWNRESLSGKVRCEVSLTEKDGKITGTYKDDEDVKAEVGEVKLEDDNITIKLVFDNDGKKSEVVLEGKLDGDKITGKMIDGSDDQKWKATRFISLTEAAGKWRLSMTTPDGQERNPEFELKIENDKPVVGFVAEGGDEAQQADNTEITKIKYKDGLLIFDVALEFDGQDLKLEYELEMVNADELEGSMFYEFEGAEMSGDVDVTGDRIK